MKSNISQDRDPYDIMDDTSDFSLDTTRDSINFSHIKLFILFETYSDVSSEYDMLKIKQNKKEFEKLSLILNKKTDFKTVGCVAHFNQISNLVKQKFQVDIGDSNYFQEIKSIREGLICFIKENKVLFIYKYPIEAFMNGPLDSSLTHIVYVRYLTDMCETILVFPQPEYLNLIEKSLSNPFREKKHNSIDIVEHLLVRAII